MRLLNPENISCITLDKAEPKRIIKPNVLTGEGVIFSKYCFVGEMTVLDDNVVLRDGVILEGDCIIGKNTIIGNNSLIHKFVTTGENCVIGNNVIVNEFSNISSGTEVPDNSIVSPDPENNKNIIIEFRPTESNQEVLFEIDI